MSILIGEGGGSNNAKELLQKYTLNGGGNSKSTTNTSYTEQNEHSSKINKENPGNYESDMPNEELTPLNQEVYNKNMEYPTRQEIDAKLETIEVKMDSRMTRIEDALRGISQSQAEVLSSNKATRTTIVVTGISTVLAVVLGVGAFNATVLSNMVSSFESGKNTASMLAAAEKSIVEATKSLETVVDNAKGSGRAQKGVSPSGANGK